MKQAGDGASCAVGVELEKGQEKVGDSQRQRSRDANRSSAAFWTLHKAGTRRGSRRGENPGRECTSLVDDDFSN